MNRFVENPPGPLSRDMFSITLICVVVLCIFIICTWWGIGLRPDSTIYLGLWDEGRQQAPLYKALVATVNSVVQDPMRAAWIINLALYLVNSIAFFWIVKTCSGQPDIAFIASIILILLPQFAYVHYTVLSESLFLTLLLATIVALALHIQSGSWLWLIAASAGAAAAVLTRFAAAPLIGAAGLMLLAYGRGMLPQRFWRAVAFGFVSTVLFVGLLLINMA